MVSEMPKTQGMPNWADCATTDLEAAERFYASVFGWTSEHITGSDGSVYSLQRLDGKAVAGIYELNEQMRQMGVPPHWGMYLEVDDIDATLELVKTEGGTLLDGPFDEPDVGRMAIIQDPVGAFVRVWHSEAGHGVEVRDLPGALAWNELNTTEPERAAAFYRKVFGLAVEEMKGPISYTTLSVGSRPVAGIWKTAPEMSEVPSSWNVYFASDNVDVTIQKALLAGGQTLRGAFEISGVGRMAVLQDPLGAVFEVIRMRTR